MSSRYEESGVSIENGEELVARLKKKSALIGGFAGIFPLKRYVSLRDSPLQVSDAMGRESGGESADDDLLVACTDGIGTKIELGLQTQRIQGLGQDLVAMCVNDLVVTGAKPLFFLDYYATSKLDVNAAESFIDGIRGALEACGAVLLGGETAEMPGFYPGGHFDAAGFAVGVVKRKDLIDGSAIRPGDVLVALPSSGLHSNGFSLVRKLVHDGMISLNAPAPGEASGVTWGRVLTTPTRLYVADTRRALQVCRINGMAHITGGGLTNIDRVLPPGMRAEIDFEAVASKTPEHMRTLVRLAEMSNDEAYRVWNMGVGFVYILPATDVSAFLKAFPDAYGIGRIV